MRFRIRGHSLAIVLIAIGATLGAQTVSPRPARIEVVSPKPPTPFTVNGSTILAYELHVTNLGFGALGFRQLDVLDGGRSAPLATYRDSMLQHMLEPVGSMHATDSGAMRLEPGQRTLVFVWLKLPPGAPRPTTLRHRFLFEILDSADARRDRGAQSVLDSVFVAVEHGEVPVLAAPFAGGEWVAASGPSNESSHRRTLNAVGGRGWNAERFATDWNKVGPNGSTFHGDEHVNANYWGFGEPLHAIADGEVVAVVDSIADHPPHGPIPPVTLRNIAGNYVTIRIGTGQYVSYGHLQRGSVQVRVHQRVERGDILARLGNTGQSTAPHLHLQVTDGPSFIASEGIPFLFERFNYLGDAADFEENRHPTIPRRNEMTLENQVIGFP